MKQCQSVVAGKQELNQSWSRELFKFFFSILLKNFSFEQNKDIEKQQTWDTFVFCKNYNVQFHFSFKIRTRASFTKTPANYKSEESLITAVWKEVLGACKVFNDWGFFC